MISTIHPAPRPVVRIVLLEDNPGDAELLRLLLVESGMNFELEIFQQIASAAPRLAAGNVDLILSDLSLPDGAGDRTFAALRKAAPETPIIILSGLADEEIAVKMVERGAQDYLVKGCFNHTALLRSIRYALERHRWHCELKQAHDALEQRVAARTAELTTTAAELQKALEQLKVMQQRIVQQERLHALGRMASGIAHDFNNALVPIVGLSELLLGPSSTAKAKTHDYLRLIHTAATDGAEVVRRLREFYRYRDENDVFAPVSINEMVRQVVALTKPRWKDQALGRGAQISFILDLQKVPPVAGNEAELRELLINLIFNAVDAIEHDGTITCRTFRRGSAVAVQISDTGIGMSEEVRLRCLEPFFSTKADHGTGLGLAMVFGIVRRHDGELEIESAPGEGTTITLSFVPYDETEIPLRGSAVAAPVKPLKILVVDDEPSVREVLGAMLSEDSHEVETACDGREGFEMFRRGTWDLVMTDRAMPQMNGDQLAVAIKQLNPQMPVVLVTGFADVMQDVGDNPPAIDAVVRKPFNRDSLRAAIAQVVPSPGRDVSLAQFSKQLSRGSPVSFRASSP